MHIATVATEDKQHLFFAEDLVVHAARLAATGLIAALASLPVGALSVAVAEDEATLRAALLHVERPLNAIDLAVGRQLVQCMKEDANRPTRALAVVIVVKGQRGRFEELVELVRERVADSSGP
jgi:hypothetical protein